MAHSNSPAPIWRRLAALGYDLFILTAISFTYGALVTTFAVKFGHIEAKDYQPMFHGLLFQLGWIFCLAGFYCWFWFKSGQTIGMKTWKIQLRAEDDSNPSWQNCLLRCLVAPPSILILGLGFWLALLDPHKRSLQDRLSGTRVNFVP